jgi:hypothetical protein
MSIQKLQSQSSGWEQAQVIESPPLEPAAGPINNLPHEYQERIIFLTEKSDKSKTRLVSRRWKTLTLQACKFSQKPGLEQFIRLLITNLKKHPHRSSDLTGILDMLRSLDRFLVTPAQTERLFLITKRFIAGVIRKLSPERRDKVQQRIEHQIPNSLHHLFRCANMSIEDSIETEDFDEFYIVFNSRTWLEDDLGKGVISAAKIGHAQILRTLIASQSLSTDHRELALQYALENHHLACVAVLAASGPISEPLRGKAVIQATEEAHIELVQLLLKNASIPEENRGEALITAILLNKPEIVQLLIGSGPIPKKFKMRVPNAAAPHKDLILNQLLRSYDLL